MTSSDVPFPVHPQEPANAAPLSWPWEETVRILSDHVAVSDAEFIAARLAERGLIAADRHGHHRYLSTGCLHGRHDHCNAMVGTEGEKRPGSCKFCGAVCVCPACRHGEASA